MKYKALLIGKNNSLMDVFFLHLTDNFEVISSSTRYGDIVNHLKHFDPDVFIYCLYNESLSSIRQMVSIKPLLKQSRIPFVIIGAKEDCDEFDKTALNVSNMTIVKPFTASTIREKLVDYLDERQSYIDTYGKNVGETDEITPRDDIDIDSLRNAISSIEAALTQEEPEAVKDISAKSDIRAAIEKEDKMIPTLGENAENAVEERKHILVVDDDPIMLKTVKEQLHEDYDVATAISGKIAMKFLERKKTDLILLDYEMPVDNGPAVLNKIRSNEDLSDIPVVFLTGVSDRDKIREAIALRPQGYLLKPIDHDKLIEAINNYIV